MKKTFVPLLFTLVLAACTQPIVDAGLMDLPRAMAEPIRVDVGEPVEVTLTGGFELEAESDRPQDIHQGFRLGACFFWDEDETGRVRGGTCEQGNIPLPDSLSMLSGTTYVKDFGDLVIDRGEHRKVKHTFIFTSTVPGSVFIAPAYQSSLEGAEPINFEMGGVTQVTFE